MEGISFFLTLTLALFSSYLALARLTTLAEGPFNLIDALEEVLEKAAKNLTKVHTNLELVYTVDEGVPVSLLGV